MSKTDNTFAKIFDVDGTQLLVRLTVEGGLPSVSHEIMVDGYIAGFKGVAKSPAHAKRALEGFNQELATQMVNMIKAGPSGKLLKEPAEDASEGDALKTIEDFLDFLSALSSEVGKSDKH